MRCFAKPIFNLAAPLLVLLRATQAAEAAAAAPDASGGCCGLDAGYDVVAVAQQATRLANHSWEYGTASEALLELYSPKLAVFSDDPFPGGRIPRVDVPKVKSLSYAIQWIRTDNDTLIDGDGAVGDPASLGVSALLIGHSSAPNASSYTPAAAREANSVLTVAPRFYNGAISHRYSVAELWADFIYMAPPFLAYYAVSTNDEGLLREVVKQCGLYRQILQANTTKSYEGLWEHIIGPQTLDTGLWSTGNGWAAMGMARVLATLRGWKGETGEWKKHASTLKRYIKEIVDGAMNVKPDSGLLRNYLNDTTWFGETSGTSILTATVYRMAVIDPETFGPSYVRWAESNRRVIASHVDSKGIVAPAVNPLGWGDRKPFLTGSPEGESFAVLLYSAWRDWKAVSH